MSLVRGPHNDLKTSSVRLITATRRGGDQMPWPRHTNVVFTSKIPAGSEISSSHRASGVPAGVRSVPRWRGGTL